MFSLHHKILLKLIKLILKASHYLCPVCFFNFMCSCFSAQSVSQLDCLTPGSPKVPAASHHIFIIPSPFSLSVKLSAYPFPNFCIEIPGYHEASSDPDSLQGAFSLLLLSWLWAELIRICCSTWLYDNFTTVLTICSLYCMSCPLSPALNPSPFHPHSLRSHLSGTPSASYPLDLFPSPWVLEGQRQGQEPKKGFVLERLGGSVG